jgi:hypothetical protein
MLTLREGLAMSLSLGDITIILKEHWKPFKGDNMKVYSMGTIFKLSVPKFDDAYYILAVQEPHGTFALINLDYGSRMSKSTAYEGGGITQEEVEKHAGYFLNRGGRLVVLEDVSIHYSAPVPERKTRRLEGGI